MSLWVCECFCRRACIYLYLWIWVEAIIKVLTLKKSLACDISSVLIGSVLLHLAETAKWCKKKKILCNPLTLQINFTSRCLCIWFYASFSSFKCLFYFRIFTNQIFCVPHTHTHTKQTAWTTTENSYLLPTLSLPNMDAINSFWTYSFSPLTQEINWRIKQPSKQWFKVGGCVLGVWLSPGLACDKSVGAEMSSSNWMLIKGKCHGESGSAFGLEHFIAGLVWYYIGDVTTDTAGYPRTDYAIDIQLMQQISRQNSDVISLLWMATVNCFGINFTRAL